MNKAELLMHRTYGSTVRIVVFSLLGIAVLVYLEVWIPGLPGPHHGAYMARGSLHNIYQALRIYDEAYGHLPPATATDPKSDKLISWRIEAYQFYVRHGFIRGPENGGNVSIDYDRRKAWNDPTNVRLEGLGRYLFDYTQVDLAPRAPSEEVDLCKAYYKAVTGPDSAFDSSTPRSLKQLPSNLILIVRVEESDTHWMEPGDLSIEELAPTGKTKQLLLGTNGYVVLFADGEGWVLSGRLSLSDLCKFFTISGAKEADREKILGPYRILP